VGPKKPEKTPAKTAGDMGKFRNVIGAKGIEYFSAQVQRQDQDKG
jgi:hypothetical protein